MRKNHGHPALGFRRTADHALEERARSLNLRLELAQPLGVKVLECAQLQQVAPNDVADLAVIWRLAVEEQAAIPLPRAAVGQSLVEREVPLRELTREAFVATGERL